MAEKLNVGTGITELKLGQSFAKNGSMGFHTVRYDFKPASVDSTQVATVGFADNHQVRVSVPNIEGSGNNETVFQGSKKPYHKECVLIIDHVTGEITLEKLAYNIQLKKTRNEGTRKYMQRPITPIDPVSLKPSPSSAKSSPMRKPVFSPSEPSARISPHQSISPTQRSPPNTLPSPPSQSSQFSPSMPSFGSSQHSSNNLGQNRKPKQSPPVKSSMASFSQLLCDAQATSGNVEDVGILSDSSSNSDDHVPDNEIPNPVRRSSKKSDSGNHSGSGTGKKIQRSYSKEQNCTNDSSTNHSSANMARLSQLSEDLQLSESGSDSDS
ncbi:EAF1 (predicted) [Pycnogonum litorale]